MSLPNPAMSFSPLDPLAAAELNDLVENIEALQDGTAFDTNTNTATFGPAWASFTSTPANFTLGNGVMTGKYIQIGKTVHFDLYIKLGSSSSMGTGPTFTLPVTASSRYDVATFPALLTIGRFNNWDVSATVSWQGDIVLQTDTTFAPLPLRTDAVWLANLANVMSSTQPAAAYGTGDLLWFTGTYEAV